MFLRQPSLDDWSYSMEDVLARQVICRSDLRFPGRFRVSLHPHDISALLPKLDSGVGVDTVIDTSMVRNEAPAHLRICGIDNGIRIQSGDVSLFFCIRSD